MWAKILIAVNISMFILILSIFVYTKIKEKRRFFEIRNNLSQILSRPVETIIILGYQNPAYEKVDDLLASGVYLGDFVILFSGPEWLYNIKKKSWILYQTVHLPSLSGVHLSQRIVGLIKFENNRLTVINEVAEYLFIENKSYKTNHIMSVSDHL
ncbi:hypothetical protein D3C76_348670 [compost metagenome]